jgi:phosphoribosylaminoimidazolecarboxamide formyltransferase/IMP cyclohydrolase
VKTLHPKIFGGILARMNHPGDLKEMQEYEIPPVDLVVVDLYPFEDTVKSAASEEDIIEKIDIGGISLIRAAAKNFEDVVIIPSQDHYSDLLKILTEGRGMTSLEERKQLALQAFNTSSHYDTAIFNYFNRDRQVNVFKQIILKSKCLRYGENPHQRPAGLFIPLPSRSRRYLTTTCLILRPQSTLSMILLKPPLPS